MKSQKVIFHKSQKLLTEHLHGTWRKATYSEHSIAIHSMSMVGYHVTILLAFVCGVGKLFLCDFLKITWCDFIAFFSFLTQANLFF